jgi:hypothetical protein
MNFPIFITKLLDVKLVMFWLKLCDTDDLED